MYTPWHREKSVFNANGSTHARQRKVLAPAFSERAVREYEPILVRYVGQLMDRLRLCEDADEDFPFDLANLYQCTTLDIVADICGREPTRFLEDVKIQGGWQLEVEQKLYHLMMCLRTFSLLTWLLVRIVISPIHRLAKEDQDFDPDAAKTRYASKTDGLANGNEEVRVDMWRFAQKDEDGSITMPREEMKENVELLMFAGSETTATLLTGTTYHLLRNPEKLEKLLDILDSTFSSTEQMTMASLVKVDYLNACLREGLRMHPPAPSNMLRKVPPEGAVICGHLVPGGTEVSASPYALDRLDQYWHNAQNYEPERWLGEQQYESDARDAFQPFATGPQNCLGMA